MFSPLGGSDSVLDRVIAEQAREEVQAFQCVIVNGDGLVAFGQVGGRSDSRSLVLWFDGIGLPIAVVRSVGGE